MSTSVEMQFRAFALDPASDRAVLIADIERVLAQINARSGTTFTHDGEEADGNITYTVWTDDPEGLGESSWIRLTDDEDRGAMVVEINATTPAIVESVSLAFVSALPVTQRIDHAPRPF